MGLSVEAAVGKASAPINENWRAVIRGATPDQLSWFDLRALTDEDPERGHAVWEWLKSEAVGELESGHRAATAVDSWPSRPWEPAHFLAIRDTFREEWRPRGGIESALLDTLALAFTAQLHWMSRHFTQVGIESMDEEAGHSSSNRRWRRPRLTDAEATDQSAAMADRFDRLVLRTLRGLRDLRRYSPQVVVQQAGQVNVAEQQVNIARQEQ